MNPVKNSISILEELAAIQKIPRPEYNVTVVPQGFRCEIKCGSISVNAVACNKKIAKHECATQALIKLQYMIKVSAVDEPTNEAPVFNAVGRLNEMCAQNGAAYADYIDHGWQNDNFVIECKCLSYNTAGRSTTKKKAKQLAAMEMLTKIQLSGFEKRRVTPEFNHVEILDLYKDLKQSAALAKLKIEDFRNSNERMQFQPKNDQISLKELTRQLCNLGVEFTVETLQRKPLLLILKATTLTGVKYNFLESRGNYDECYAQLLHSAIDAITILNN